MIYLLRHGDAEDGNGDDAARRLTPKGERTGTTAGLRARRDGDRGRRLPRPAPRSAPPTPLASPARRSAVEPEDADELRGGRFDSLSLAAGPRQRCSWSATSPTSRTRSPASPAPSVKLRKGGLAIVDGSTLIALLRPRELAALAANGG